jgi:ATP-binding cassette subfamily B protein
VDRIGANGGPVRRLSTLRRVGGALALAGLAAPVALGSYLVLTVAAGAAPVAVAWFTKLLIDDVVGHVAAARLGWLVVGLAVAGVVAGVLPTVTQYVRAELDREVGLRALDRLFAALEGFVGLSRFEEPDFLNRLRLAQQTGGLAASEVVAGGLGAAQAAITVVGFLGALAVVSPLLTAVVLLAAVPSLVAEIVLSRQRARTLWQVTPAERREVFYHQLLSSVEAAKEVRLFGIGGFLRTKMVTDRRTVNAAKRRMDRRHVAVQTALGMLVAAVSAGGILWAVRAAWAGTLSPGSIVVLVATLAGVQGALSMLAGQIAHMHHSLLMFDHYLAVTEAGPDLPVAAPAAVLPPLRRGIEVRDVWFRYTDDHPWVLEGVSLFIPYGQAVAIVGENGAGKSTLVKLLCRFYDPTKGSILWDGADIRDVDPSELRRRMGAVFQDYMSYDLTVRENIAVGDVSAIDDRPRLEEAARTADVHEHIARLPYGYDTPLSRVFPPDLDGGDAHTGVELSGGQWQRLALARAFLRQHREFTVLDEPSSGLDAEAEHRIHAALTRHRAGRTSLLISHRLSAVRDADLIVVLANGRVVEAGDHTGLLGAGGEYARLFGLQAAGYEP